MEINGHDPHVKFSVMFLRFILRERYHHGIIAFFYIIGNRLCSSHSIFELVDDLDI